MTDNVELEPDDLPPDVLEALAEGRKIEAIRRLREHEYYDLREAKERIDRHAAASRAERPADMAADSQQYIKVETGTSRLVILAVVAGLAFVLYRLLS